MANPRTIARLESRIRERAAYCIEFELSDPRSALVTITRVELSNDLSSGKIFYSVLGTESEKSKVAHMFESAAGYIQRKVARVLELRRTPHLTWVYDDSIERAAQIDSAIQDALERDREIQRRRSESSPEGDPAGSEDTGSEPGPKPGAEPGPA